MILGSHVSTAGGLPKACQRGKNVGCDCIQIFVTPPRRWPVFDSIPRGAREDELKLVRPLTKNTNRWAGKPLTDEAIESWQTALADSGLTHPIAHASYLINMATPKDDLFAKSIDALVDEMERGNALGLEGLVVHPGAYTDSSEADGINRIIDAVAETLGRVDLGSCRLLLENTAGQGSCLGFTLDQLAQMLDGIADDARVGVCLDTCHAFAAGYEINTTDGFSEMRKEIDDLLPSDCIAAVHLNDSKKPLGSRVDRHEHIGRGEIGLDGFRNLFADPLLGSLPGYLETEKGTDDASGEDWDVVNLRVLRDLVGQAT